MGRRLDMRYTKARGMYEVGMSVAWCADYYGITRQAMHKILIRRGTKMRPQKKHGQENHFFRGGGDSIDVKRKAQHAAHRAIREGILKPEPCEECSAEGIMEDGRNRVHAHHDDYREPLSVRWLCQPCHYEWHKHHTAKGGRPVSNADRPDVICGGYP